MNPHWRQRRLPSPATFPGTNTSDKQSVPIPRDYPFVQWFEEPQRNPQRLLPLSTLEPPISVQPDNPLTQRRQRGSLQCFEPYPATQTRSETGERGNMVSSSFGTPMRGMGSFPDPYRIDDRGVSAFGFDPPPVLPQTYWPPTEQRQQFDPPPVLPPTYWLPTEQRQQFDPPPVLPPTYWPPTERRQQDFPPPVVAPIMERRQQNDPPPVIPPILERRQQDDPPPVLSPIIERRQQDDPPPVLAPVMERRQQNGPPPMAPSIYRDSLERRETALAETNSVGNQKSLGSLSNDQTNRTGTKRKPSIPKKKIPIPAFSDSEEDAMAPVSRREGVMPQHNSDSAQRPKILNTQGQPIVAPATAPAPLNSHQPGWRPPPSDPSSAGGLAATVATLPGQSNIAPSIEEYEISTKSPGNMSPGPLPDLVPTLVNSASHPMLALKPRPPLLPPSNEWIPQPGQGSLGGDGAGASQAAQEPATEAFLAVQQHANRGKQSAKSKPLLNRYIDMESTDEETADPSGDLQDWELDNLTVYRVWMRSPSVLWSCNLFIETHEDGSRRNCDGSYDRDMSDKGSAGHGRYYSKYAHGSLLYWDYAPPPEQWDKWRPFDDHVGSGNTFAYKQAVGLCPKGMLKYVLTTLDRVMGPSKLSDGPADWFHRAWLEKAIKRLKKHHCLKPLSSGNTSQAAGE